jgi:hypothetical protein
MEESVNNNQSQFGKTKEDLFHHVKNILLLSEWRKWWSTCLARRRP